MRHKYGYSAPSDDGKRAEGGAGLVYLDSFPS
jgi:hypothetical protein